MLEFSSFNNSLLLLDDEFDITTVLKQSLEKQGFHVFGFTDPLLALEHFQTNSGKYSLVISDIRMPEMNGYEFTRRVKEIKPGVNLFLMTALEIDGLESNRVLPSIRIDELIQKPISAASLANVINKYIKNETKLKPDPKMINRLDLPDGLKEQLANHDLTIEQLMAMKISDLAEELGIDHYVAQLIVNAIR